MKRRLSMTDAEWAQIQREEACEARGHDFGPMCYWTFMGCSRTCAGCGQTVVDPNHCGQYDARRSTSAKP